MWVDHAVNVIALTTIKLAAVGSGDWVGDSYLFVTEEAEQRDRLAIRWAVPSNLHQEELRP